MAKANLAITLDEKTVTDADLRAAQTFNDTGAASSAPTIDERMMIQDQGNQMG